MKYIPSEEAEEINYQTERHPWLNVIVLVVSAIALYLVFIFAIGLFGETLAVKIPPKYETSIFSFMDFEIAKKPWPLGQEIVDDIFARNEIDPELKPQIFLSCGDMVNALALPGKRIIVFKGLLKDIKSLNSLYFVIGHEIGHVIHRDHLRSIGRALAISIGLFFVNVGTDSNSFFSFNQAIIDRRFNQNQETASDNEAIKFTVKRFNGLHRSHDFFDQISKTEIGSTKLSGFLNTHPLTEHRIEKIKNHKDYNTDTTNIEGFDSKTLDCP
ncbi:MAG: M48 family metallopeptidase [Bdellovibrionaceae bacterium]|nr:M48 family metallopeptidase [Pseudobdellovibrionaceae bacterium]